MSSALADKKMNSETFGGCQATHGGWYSCLERLEVVIALHKPGLHLPSGQSKGPQSQDKGRIQRDLFMLHAIKTQKHAMNLQSPVF